MKDVVESELIAWGKSQPDVRAMILTSTRAIPDAEIDTFSDYDVIVVTTDVRARFENREWLQAFGTVVIDWWDPLDTDPEIGLLTTGNIVYYPGTRKIDFTLWPVEMSAVVARELPAELDAGYRVLLDKDALTASWAKPSGRGYAVMLPDCAEYQEAVRGFLVGVPYVVTALKRGELLPAKWVLDYDMRYEYLIPMMKWYAAVIHGEALRIGVHGKGLLPLLPHDIRRHLEQTYALLDESANYQALREMVALFRNVAERVGESTGCAYPADLHDRVMMHISALDSA